MAKRTGKKQFTKDKVNDILRSRLERQRKSLLSHYGVKTTDELNELIGKAQSYSAIKELHEEALNELREVNQQLAFVNNNINPNRKADIQAYFKGKRIGVQRRNSETRALTHPEWLKTVSTDKAPKTTLRALGVDKQTALAPESEDSKIKRVFGL